MNDIHYKINMVCKLTGLKPELLRSWELRYDFLKPLRGPGGQRLYNPQDLDLLFRIKELLDRGHSISELNQWGKDRMINQAPVTTDNDALFHAVSSQTVNIPVADLLSQLIGQIVSGAVACDQEQIDRNLDKAATVFSQQIVIHDIIRKSAIQIGLLWKKGDCSIAGEHLGTALFTRRIEAYLASRRDPFAKSRPKALCTCIPDEQHVLGSQLVACHLFDMGYNAITIHGGLPFASLEAAAHRIACQHVYLSVSSENLFACHRSSLIDFTRRMSTERVVTLGGRGVTADSELTDLGIRLCPNGQPITTCPEKWFEGR